MARHLNWIGAAAAALSLAGCSYVPPDCDAPELVKSVTDVINGNDEIKGLELSVKEIRGLKETARDETKNTRACAGEMELSNGQVLDLQIDLAQDPKDQTIFIPTIRWTPRD